MPEAPEIRTAVLNPATWMGRGQDLPHHRRAADEIVAGAGGDLPFQQLVLEAFGPGLALHQFQPEVVQLGDVPVVGHHQVDLAVAPEDGGAGDQELAAGPLGFLENGHRPPLLDDLQGDRLVDDPLRGQLADVPADPVPGREVVDPLRGPVDSEDPALAVADPDAVEGRIEDGLHLLQEPALARLLPIGPGRRGFMVRRRLGHAARPLGRRPAGPRGRWSRYVRVKVMVLGSVLAPARPPLNVPLAGRRPRRCFPVREFNSTISRFCWARVI